jgi:ankyrin repeat protein
MIAFLRNPKVDLGQKAALIYAAKSDDMESVSHLLDAKAKLNAADHHGTTVLMFAMQFPDLRDFVLIQQKLKIDAQHHEG